MSKEKFSISQLSKILLKYSWLIAIIVVASVAGTIVLRPKDSLSNTVSAQVLVSPKKEYDISNGTLLDYAKTDRVLGNAIEDYNKTTPNKLDYGKMFDTVRVTVNGNSRIVTISADESDSLNAKKLVRNMANQMAKNSTKDMPVLSASVVSKPSSVSFTTEGFSKKKSIILGGLVGLFLGSAVAFIIEGVTGKKKSLSK